MTVAEKKLLQDTHDSIIRLTTIIIGNGVPGIAERVKENSDFIAKIKDLPKLIEKNSEKIAVQEKRFDKVYYKIIGGGVVFIAVVELIAKLILKV